MRSMVRNRFIDAGFMSLLQNTAFRCLFAGRVITDTGDSLYYIGAMWLVWELTGSPFYTGLAGALLMVPNVLSFLIGPLVDRWRLRRVLLGTQLINGVGVLIVPVAAVTGYLSVWLILVLLPVLDFINGFVYPAQTAALPKIVGKENLTRANSLFSTSLRTIDIVADAVGGLLLAVIGGVALFVLDSVTFALAAVLFVGVTVPQTTQDDAGDAAENSDGTEDSNATSERYLAELREGIDYIRGSAFAVMLFGMMVNNFGAIAATAVLPAFADSLAGPATYGLLLAAMGAGNLIGTGAAFLVDEYSVGHVAIIGNVLSGLLWLAAVAAPSVWGTGMLLFAATIPSGAFNVLFGSMYQSAVDDALLGRVSSLITTLVTMMMPAGALLGGAIASVVGSMMVMYGVGGVTALVGLYYLAHPRLRSLPSVTKADEAALGL